MSKQQNKVIDNQHEKSKIDEYAAQGYTASYRLEGDKLIDLSTDKKYSAADVKIVDEYRYEGISDPADMSILYILEMKDKSKGILLAAYGPSGDLDLGEFMKEVSLSDQNSDRSTLNKMNN